MCWLLPFHPISPHLTPSLPPTTTPLYGSSFLVAGPPPFLRIETQVCPLATEKVNPFPADMGRSPSVLAREFPAVAGFESLEETWWPSPGKDGEPNEVIIRGLAWRIPFLYIYFYLFLLHIHAMLLPFASSQSRVSAPTLPPPFVLHHRNCLSQT